MLNLFAQRADERRIIAISLDDWLNLATGVEDLLKRTAESEDHFLRQRRAQVRSTLIAIQEHLRNQQPATQNGVHVSRPNNADFNFGNSTA